MDRGGIAELELELRHVCDGISDVDYTVPERKNNSLSAPQPSLHLPPNAHKKAMRCDYENRLTAVPPLHSPQLPPFSLQPVPKSSSGPISSAHTPRRMTTRSTHTPTHTEDTIR